MNPHTLQIVKAQVASLCSKYSELDEDEQLRIDTIEGETDFINAMRQLLREADEAGAFAEAMAGVIRDATQRRERMLYREERRRADLLSLMQAANLKKLPLPEATISVLHRNPSPIKPDTVDGLPDEYVRIKKEPDMLKIKAAIAVGEKIDGITMSNGGVSLMVRR